MAASRLGLNGRRMVILLLAAPIILLLYRKISGDQYVFSLRPSSQLAMNSLLSTPAFATTRKSAAKFAIMSMSTQDTSYDYYAISNKYKYAAKHNYDFLVDWEPSIGYEKTWDKLNLTRDAIQGTLAGENNYEWLWMLDLDTLITNSFVELEEVVERSLKFAEAEGKRREDIHMILTRDCEPLNAGSMMFRTGPWMLEMIEKWRTHEVSITAEVGPRHEQGALRDMIEKNIFSVADNSVIVPQVWINAYPKELDCYDTRDKALQRPWREGDFVIHFAGVSWWHPEMKDPVGTLMRRYFELAG